MSLRLFGLLASGAFVLSAASVPIGVLTTIGSVRMDNSEVRGSGTVLDGSVVETSVNPSQLSLKNGTRLEFAANSRAQIYDDKLVLEKGSSQIHAASAFPVMVNSLKIVPTSSSTIRVFRTSPKVLEVAAVSGQAEVRNTKGILIAKVLPGSALDFQEQPGGAAAPSQVSGKVSKQNGRYLLTDSTTNTTVEVQGDNLEATVGHCIAATGSQDTTATPATGASQVIHVTSYRQVSCGRKGAAAAAGAAAGAGLSAAAIGAIVAGVAVAGTLGGLAAAGTFSGGKAAGVS